MSSPSVDSANVALLIVDMTLGFTDPRSPLGCAADSAVESIAELLVAARTHDVPVVYTRVAFREPISPGGRLFRELVPPLAELVDGQWPTLVDPRIGPVDRDLLLRKECASAFWGTGLHDWITADRIDTLVLTGASTSGCVRATAVDALQHGVKVFIPESAVADRDPAAHQQALADISWRYGRVLPQSAALDLLSTSSRRPDAAARAYEQKES